MGAGSLSRDDLGAAKGNELDFELLSCESGCSFSDSAKQQAILTFNRAHPYEEPSYDVYKMENF
jgi:hypothetical protein